MIFAQWTTCIVNDISGCGRKVLSIGEHESTAVFIPCDTKVEHTITIAFYCYIRTSSSTFTNSYNMYCSFSGSAIMQDGSTVRNGYQLDLDVLSVGSRIGMMRASDGTLHYYLDGVDMGVACTDIPQGRCVHVHVCVCVGGGPFRCVGVSSYS